MLNKISFLIIPVLFLGCMNGTVNEYETIYAAMASFDSSTEGSVKFRYTPTDGDIVFIKADSDIFKGLTVSKAGQTVIVLDTVDNRTIVHETCHVLGLIHEHQRPDRDAYIRINYDALFKKDFSVIFSFMFLTPSKYQYSDYDYDYTSVMHYNAEDVGDVLDDNAVLGGDSLSEIDKQKLKDIYSENNIEVTYSVYGFSTEAKQ
jgi:hypothetical protein